MEEDKICPQQCGLGNDPFITDGVKSWLRLMEDIMEREAGCSFADQQPALSTAHSL